MLYSIFEQNESEKNMKVIKLFGEIISFFWFWLVLIVVLPLFLWRIAKEQEHERVSSVRTRDSQ